MDPEDQVILEGLDDSYFDDPEDFEDDITDEELLGDILKEKPVLDLSIDNVIVVDNAPKVKMDRLAKLESVLTKVFSKFGDVLNQYHPTDSNGVTKGYFFMELATAEQAVEAVTAGNGYRLDKTHVFSVNHFSDFDTYQDLPENWEPPKKRDYQYIGNLRSWLLNPNCNDQFCVIYGGGVKTAVANNTSKGPKLVLDREGWTDTYARWSTQGSYLLTFHLQKGVAIWGTEDFKRIQRFYHPNAQLADFSPCEGYVSTARKRADSLPKLPSQQQDEIEDVIVWDVRTGVKKRGFTWAEMTEWPFLKWSHTGEYFAKRGKDLLSVYVTPLCGLLDKESLLIKGLVDFQWSPTSNMIAYWVPEQGANPAKVAILEIPSRKEIRSKNLFQVSECQLQWHKQGDYLCVCVKRWATKSKKNLYYNVEIFHMREQDIPVDTVEMKESVISYAMEPTSSRLVILYGAAPRIKCNIYNVRGKGAKLELLATINTKLMSTISWSPRGQYMVLAALKSSETTEGYLEFYDTGTASLTNVSLVTSVEHGDMTDLEWDPTGRFVTTSVSYWSSKRDTGFIMWSFQGKLLCKQPVQMDKFCQFLWRPRPPTLLDKDAIERIKKDLKSYAKKFDVEDRIVHQKASEDLLERRKKLMKDYEDFRKRIRQRYQDKIRKYPEYIEQDDDEILEEEILHLDSEEIQHIDE